MTFMIVALNLNLEDEIVENDILTIEEATISSETWNDNIPRISDVFFYEIQPSAKTPASRER